MDTKIGFVVITVFLLALLIILLWNHRSTKLGIRELIRQLEETGTDPDESGSHFIRLNHSGRELERLAELVNQKFKTDRKLKVQMECQYEQMQQMISGLAHDFRTPITVILGFLELMEKDGANHSEYMAAIRNRTMQLNTSVNRLYDYFRIGSSKTVLNRPVDLKSFLLKILGDLYEVINGYKAEVNLDIKCADCTIFADEEMLSRVLENLLINAAKYSAGKTIDITLREGGGSYLDLSIANDSAPFQDNELERIFDLFYRKDTSRHDGSSGIGLSIVKSFVEKMHGNVAAKYIDRKFIITVSFRRHERMAFESTEE